MSKNSNFIEINGVRYDARTGEYIAHVYTSGTPHHTAQKEVETPAVKRPTMHDVVRSKPKPAAARKPKSSKTLMRHAVKKPSTVKHQTAAKTVAHKPTSLAVKKSVTRVDNRRLHKARQVPQSRLISHFAPNTGVGTSVMPTNPDTIPVQIRPVHPHAPPKSQSARRTTNDLLEHALKHANSHEQPHHPVKKRRRHTGVAMAAVFVLAAGVIGYQQLPSFKLEVASARAGFNADLPGYKPAGYTLRKLNYSPGVIASQFQNDKSQRAYTLIQRESNWSSQELQDSFVAPADKNYRSRPSAGMVIYFYNGSNATWVNGGVWYQVQNDGSLNDQQIIDLANSL